MQPLFEAGITYHVFNRANNYENLFIEEKNYSYFIKLMSKYLLPIADIYAYCLMPNHFHFVLKIKSVDELPAQFSSGKRLHMAFSNMFNAYAKAINKSYGRRGSLFQKHLKRNVITEDEYLINAICYTHLNPVIHNFTNDITKYTRSSYNAIVQNDETVVDINKTIGVFDGIDNFVYNHLDLSGLQDLIGLD